jgi:geranylgeranyl pyrophosphate synthase
MFFGALFGGAKAENVAILARIGRILGILATLRDDIIDVFDIDELRQRIAAQDLPLPLIFAMRNKKTEKAAMTLISKQKLTKIDVASLVDLTVNSEPVAQLKNTMEQLINEGVELTRKLEEPKLQNTLRSLLAFMLEDL